LWQAWLVMVSCFTCNGIIFGIINTFGILFVKLRADLEAEGLKDAALKCCKLT
jgi:MCP family monocarboxylic acid transporter-like MFS transporter 10